MGPPSHIRKGDFMKYVLGAKCVKCGREYPAAPGLTTCACGGILDIVYDYAAIRRHFFPKSLADCRDYSMWRYRPLLPVEEESVPPPLRVGWSPLYKADRLARALGLTELEQLHQDGVDRNGRPYGVGRVGRCPQAGGSGTEYARLVKEALGAAGVRLTDGGRPVSRVAVGGGSCGSMLGDAAALGCDTFVTADVKYDQFLEAKALGITLMDAGHYATEQVVCPKIVEYLARCFPALEVRMSRTHREVYGWV